MLGVLGISVQVQTETSVTHVSVRVIMWNGLNEQRDNVMKTLDIALYFALITAGCDTLTVMNVMFHYMKIPPISSAL